MSDSQKQDENETSPIVNKTKDVASDSAIAMELPFTLVGAILLAGGAGFLLDRWLHTKPIFMLVLGVFPQTRGLGGRTGGGAMLAWLNFRWLGRGLDALVIASTAQEGRKKPQVP